MSFINDMLMLIKWARDGWEVHPIDFKSEFEGWL
jgi:hypothetical protein